MTKKITIFFMEDLKTVFQVVLLGAKMLIKNSGTVITVLTYKPIVKFSNISYLVL